MPVFKLIKDYLQNGKQRARTEPFYNDWKDITLGVSQGSILGSLLFNIFSCDLFLEDENNYFGNYAEITTPYFVGSMTADVLENISCLTKKLFSWFANNDKSHLIFSSPKEDAAIQIEEPRIKWLKIKKLSGMHINYKLKFDTHNDAICKKAHRNLTALSRIINYIELPKRRILMNAFFKTQFDYCRIIWMFHSGSLNNKINRLHERCLT